MWCLWSLDSVLMHGLQSYFFLLQTGRFSQFWDEASKNRHIVEAVPGIRFMELLWMMSCYWFCYQHIFSVLCVYVMWYVMHLQENWLQVLSKQFKPMQFMFFPWRTKGFPDLCLLRYLLQFYTYFTFCLGILLLWEVLKYPQLLCILSARLIFSCGIQAINIEGLSLDKFLEHHVANSGWILEKGHGRGQLIVLPRNEFNHPELKKSTDDGIPLEHVARIFPILGW